MNLKELLGEELYNQVVEKIGTGDHEILVNNKKENTYVPKTRLDMVLNQKKLLAEQVDSLEIKIDEMSKDVSNVEALKTQLQTAQDDIVKAKEEVKDVKRDAEIRFAIAESGAKKKDLVTKLIVSDKITFKEDGTIEGLKEQIEELKKEAPELFIKTQPEGKPTPNEGGKGEQDNNEDPQDDQNKGGTGSPGNGGKGGQGSKPSSIGEKLAKMRATSSPEVDYFK